MAYKCMADDCLTSGALGLRLGILGLDEASADVERPLSRVAVAVCTLLTRHFP
jgi:hypothetical protein